MNLLDNIAIVLRRPKYPENIGAAARAMKNMGFRQLLVVNPENYDLTRVEKMATHFAKDIIEGIALFDDLKKAVASYTYIIGTTARMGRHRQNLFSPSKMAHKLQSVLQNNTVAIIFGPEDKGLSNEDIKLCHALVHIPTDEFSSLNLAQAVMIICYEIFQASREEPESFIPRLATRNELEAMYDQMKEILIRISFLDPKNPDYWLNNFRRFFNRLPLSAKEVSIIRGVCRQIDWYGEKKFNDGKNDNIVRQN